MNLKTCHQVKNRSFLLAFSIHISETRMQFVISIRRICTKGKTTFGCIHFLYEDAWGKLMMLWHIPLGMSSLYGFISCQSSGKTLSNICTPNKLFSGSGHDNKCYARLSEFQYYYGPPHCFWFESKFLVLWLTQDDFSHQG